MTHDMNNTLIRLGFSEKEVFVYLALLALGPSPVRAIAVRAAINRGTTYDILRALQDRGLVSYYHKEKHQYFVAEDPEKLTHYFETRREELETLRDSVASAIPALKGLQQTASGKPVVMYYEGDRGVRTILEDVLGTMESAEHRTYDVYSSARIREHLYRSFPQFTKHRIAKKIFVHVIAMGNGGDTAPLSERRWLTKKAAPPTYTIIYGSKTAHISADAGGALIGVLINDVALAQTERDRFDYVWNTLK